MTVDGECVWQGGGSHPSGNGMTVGGHIAFWHLRVSEQEVLDQ